MPIKNYTTKLKMHDIVGRIMALLGAKGARQININYGDAGVPNGIQFILLVEGIPVPFRLPSNAAGVEKAIRRDDRKGRSPRTKEHFQSVAWAIVRDWIEAQMALVEAEQATLAQVFLPYCVVPGEPGSKEAVTMYDRFLVEVGNQKSLGTGAKAQ